MHFCSSVTEVLPWGGRAVHMHLGSICEPQGGPLGSPRPSVGGGGASSGVSRPELAHH